MRRFVLGWKTLHYERKLSARIVNYADDFVICCRGTGEAAHTAMRDMTAEINGERDEDEALPRSRRDVRLPGLHVRRCYSQRTGRVFIGTTPMRKKVRRLCDRLREDTRRRKTGLDEEEVVGRLNRKLRGWANYFKLGPVSKAYRAVDNHVTNRLRRWLCKKHKVPGQGTKQYPDDYLYDTLGLVRLSAIKRSFP